MAISHARIIRSLLVIGFACTLAASSAAQDVDATPPVNISPSLCAGLFHRSWPIPAEEGSSNREGLFRGIAFQAAAPKPDQPAHTGFSALVRAIGSDFKAFPQRKSTWAILAIGGAAAAIAHPGDVEVTEDLNNSAAAKDFFVAGKWIGSAYVQAGTAIGLYVVGRYLLPHADGAPKTNKVSHLGFDLLRALAVSQAFTQGIKIAAQRDRPTGECCAFPSGHASAAFAAASVIERHLGRRGAWPTFTIAPMWRLPGWLTTATISATSCSAVRWALPAAGRSSDAMENRASPSRRCQCLAASWSA